MVTTGEAAERLGLTPRQVRNDVTAGRIKGRLFGRTLLVAEASLRTLRRRKAGRPRKVG